MASDASITPLIVPPKRGTAPQTGPSGKPPGR
jgi:hypothetical protein